MNQRTDDPGDPTGTSDSRHPDEQEAERPERNGIAPGSEAAERDDVAEDVEAAGGHERDTPEPDADAVDEAAVSPAEPRPATEPAAAAPAHRGPAAVAWLAFLLALVSLAGVAYLGWQERDRGSESVANAQAIAALSEELDGTGGELRGLQNRLDTLGEEGVAIAEELDSLQRRLENRVDELSQRNESIAPRLAHLEDAISSLQGITAGAREHWMLAEAEYYLQIANAQLQLAGNADIASLALNFADERIRELAEPGLTGVRRALAREIQSLAAYEEADLEGVSLALANLADRVDSLPLNEQVAESPPDTTAVDPESGGVSRALASVKRAFADLVSVRRTDETTRPLMSPDAAYFLRANLALQFQSARLALLRGEPAVFRQSLGDAAAWLERYYDAESTAVQGALDTVAELRESEVETRAPDISASLRLLRQYRSQRALEGPAGNRREPAQ